MMKSYKPLSPKQEGEFWAEIEVQTNNAYKAACDLDLEKLNNALFVLNGITKRLNCSKVEKEITITDIVESKPVIRKIKIT